MTEEVEDSKLKEKIQVIIQDNDLLSEHKEVLKNYYDTLRHGRRTVFSSDPYILRRSNSNKAKSFKTFFHYLSIVSRFGKFIKKPYMEATKKDIEEFQVFLEKSCSIRTIKDYSYILKLFYIWLYRTEEIPELVSDIEKPKHALRELRSDEVLTPTDVKKLIKACFNARDKAICSLWFEASGRVSELLRLKIKDWLKDPVNPQIAKIELKGKTGRRIIALTDSVPYVERWINEHPGRDNPDSPIFISLSPNNFGNKLTTRGVQSIFKTIGKRAKLKKKINPHWFRHSGLDWLSRYYHFNERDLKLRGGWSKNSKMPQVYLHYGEDEVNNRYLEHKGIKQQNGLTNQEKELKPIECPRCGKVNSPDSRYCNCGQILDIDELRRIESLKSETNEFTDKLMKTPLTNPKDLDKGIYNALFENMINNPIMLDEFKKIIKKLSKDEK